MKYYCTNCEEDLTPDEALVNNPGSYNNLTAKGYDGEPPSAELTGCCPRCGGVECVVEREDEKE